MPTQEHASRSVETTLGQIGRRVDDLLERVAASHALVDIRDEIVKELRRIERQASATRAQIDQDLAVTRRDFVRAVEAEIDVWKGRMEELEVQATLGRMEIRDHLGPMLRLIDGNLAAVKNDIEALKDADVIDEKGLARSVQESMNTLRWEWDRADEIC